MTNLFDIPDSSPDQRRREVRMAPETNLGSRRLESVDEIQRIFRESVEDQFPHTADGKIDARTIQNWDLLNHRFRIEKGEFVIADTLGRVTPKHFAVISRIRISAKEVGTFGYALSDMERGGRWVPVALSMRVVEVAKNDRKNPMPKRTDLIEEEMEPLGGVGGEYTSMMPVPVRVVEYAIKWVDANNAPNVIRDPETGRIVSSTGKPSVTMDPAMAEAFRRSAKATEQVADAMAGSSETEGLRARVAEMEATLAEMRRPRGPVVVEASPSAPKR